MGKVKTKWIEDAAVDKNKINTDVAGGGLTGGGGSALAVTNGALALDGNPQLGADLDLNQKSIELDPGPVYDGTGNGIIITATVTTNTNGLGNAMCLNSSFQWVDADADSIASMPCKAIALTEGTGSGKRLLLCGVFRLDTWNWSEGLIYVSTSAGLFTQTQPSGDGDQVQPIGYALSDDEIMFFPDFTILEYQV